MAVRIAPKYEKAGIKSKSSAIVREISQKLSYVILDLICSYIVSENRNIKMKGYKVIKELFDIINLNDYKSDSDIERIDFIRFGLDARIKFGLTDSKEDSIITKCEVKGKIIVKYIDDSPAPVFNKNGKRVQNAYVSTGKAFKTAGFKVINDIMMAKIATNEFIPFEYTSGSKFE